MRDRPCRPNYLGVPLPARRLLCLRRCQRCSITKNAHTNEIGLNGNKQALILIMTKFSAYHVISAYGVVSFMGVVSGSKDRRCAVSIAVLSSQKKQQGSHG